jgi:hypothetical protein
MYYLGLNISPRLQMITLFACSAVAFVCAIIMAVGYALNAGYETADGTVLSNASRSTRTKDGLQPRVCPRIRFQDHERVTREFTAFDACAQTAKYEVGRRVTVYFQRNDPAYPNITAPNRLFNTMIAALVVGLFCLIAAVFVRRRRHRRTLAKA